MWPQELIDGIEENDFYVINFDNRDVGKSTWFSKEPLLIKVLKILPTSITEYFVESHPIGHSKRARSKREGFEAANKWLWEHHNRGFERIAGY